MSRNGITTHRFLWPDAVPNPITALQSSANSASVKAVRLNNGSVEGLQFMSLERIEKMRSDAQRYREMAENASDPEVAETLVQIASDLEAAIIVIEKDRPEMASCSLGYQSAKTVRTRANAS